MVKTVNKKKLCYTYLTSKNPNNILNQYKDASVMDSIILQFLELGKNKVVNKKLPEDKDELKKLYIEIFDKKQVTFKLQKCKRELNKHFQDDVAKQFWSGLTVGLKQIIKSMKYNKRQFKVILVDEIIADSDKLIHLKSLSEGNTIIIKFGRGLLSKALSKIGYREFKNVSALAIVDNEEIFSELNQFIERNVILDNKNIYKNDTPLDNKMEVEEIIPKCEKENKSQQKSPFIFDESQENDLIRTHQSSRLLYHQKNHILNGYKDLFSKDKQSVSIHNSTLIFVKPNIQEKKKKKIF